MGRWYTTSVQCRKVHAMLQLVAWLAILGEYRVYQLFLSVVTRTYGRSRPQRVGKPMYILQVTSGVV